MKPEKLIAEAERCVACGLCLPACPTYRLTLSEADSPRGRIQLVNAVAQDKLPASPRFVEHIDRCLSCRSCESVCPNKVHYGALADGARALIAQTTARPLWKKLLQGSSARILGNRALTRLSGRVLRLLQVTGLHQFARLSPRLQKLDALLPRIPKPQNWDECYPAASPRGEVCLFLGCISDMLDTDTLRAAIFVLNRFGYTVHVPLQQTCCGALARNAGDETQANALIARNSEAFSPFANLPILSIASGCGASLNDYLGRQIQDISDFLAKAESNDTAISPLAGTILVHDPCTLRNVLKQQQSVYELLRRIPDAQVLPLPGNSQCCGGAGAYMLTQETMARQLRSDKIAACRTMNATWLATSNIGCALHIAAGLKEEGVHVEVVHPVSLLAKQMGFQT